MGPSERMPRSHQVSAVAAHIIPLLRTDGLKSGHPLGVYEVVGLIGAGGMGEVYRARDTRLDRHVAIKVLPDAFRADAERAARFEREAKLLATLNHPNIAGIYGLEDSQGEQCIVMELVEGETLADRIARGPIPVAEALEIAKQIADALEAAHEKGIIHRDLKPANVKLTPDDQVKVLDFGLAKAFGLDAAHVSPDGLTNSPTLTSPIAATGVGVLLGTAAYMAPEQAKGRAVDKRGDVWAFGCVLYEMLTGQRAFTGEDVSDTLASVLRGEPQWSALGPAVPERIRVLLRRCLAKERKARIPDISVARYLLEEIAGTLAEPAQPVRAPVPASRWIAAAMSAAVASAAIVLLAIYYLGRVDSTVRPVRFAIQVEPGPLDVGSTENPATPPIAVSPDGSIVAFVATTRGTRSRLWIRPLDTLEARELSGTDGASSPFWSPDSRFIGFFADGKLKRIDVNGGPSLPLCDAPQQRGGAWSPEGFIIFGSIGKGLQKVPEAGGVPTALTTLAEGELVHSQPVFLPDGRHFFYRALGPVAGGPVYVASIDSGDRKMLIERPAASNVAYASGHLLFLRETTLMAQPFDVGTQTLTGEPVPVAADIRTFITPPVGIFSVSQTGVLVYQTGSSASVGDLTWFDRKGKPLGTVGEPAAYGDVELSPDDKRVAVSIFDPSQRSRDIWLIDVARGSRQKFTFGATDEQNASWSSDGTSSRTTRSKARNSICMSSPPTGAVPRNCCSPTGSASSRSDGRQMAVSCPTFRLAETRCRESGCCPCRRSRLVRLRSARHSPTSIQNLLRNTHSSRRTVAGWRISRMNQESIKSLLTRSPTVVPSGKYRLREGLGLVGATIIASSSS